MDLHELEEIRLDAYEGSKIYKEKTKAFHDKRILPKEFKAGDQALLFNQGSSFSQASLRQDGLDLSLSRKFYLMEQ